MNRSTLASFSRHEIFVKYEIAPKELWPFALNSVFIFSLLKCWPSKVCPFAVVPAL